MATTASEVDRVEKDQTFTSALDTHNSEDSTLKNRPANTEPLYSEKDAAIDINSSPNGEEEEKVDGFVKDPFVPFDDLPAEDRNYLTIRAILVGCCFGAIVNASNIYLGLKTGWTFTANIFGAIGGFAAMKFLEKSCTDIPLPGTSKHFSIPILSGPFGPKENGIVTTAAMAAGGLSGVFVSAWPALYQLGLLDTPDADYPRMITLTLVGGYFGFFMATPLRKFFIIHVARELRLIFPSFSASAVSIRSMHAVGTGEHLAKLKMRALSIAFVFAVVLRVVSQYALGILWDWHIFTWFYIWGGYNNLAINVENWGWLIEWTPAFIGVGMLVGLNVAFSFFAGSVLAWGIIGPILITTGTAHGANAGYPPPWEEVVSFWGLGTDDTKADSFTPRFWLLWPGVLCMIVVSFVELGCQWRIFALGGKAFYRACKSGVSQMRRKGKLSTDSEDESDPDPAAPEDRVKMWMWLPPLVLVIILTCVVTGVQFDMPIGETILAIFLAFFFSLLAVQCTGATDITPLTAASKASQLVLGGTTSGLGWGTHKAQRLNLLGGALASIGAGQASDLTGDFRVGFLLGVKPKLQWIAQGVGTIVAVFLAPAMYRLFSKAYPCINAADPGDCPFAAPSVAAWRAVAVAVTDPTFPVPKSSGIFAICFSAVGAGFVLMRNFVWVGDRAWMRAYWPNIMVMALSFVIPQTVYGTANVMGAIVAFVWAKKSPRTWDIYGYAIAAGLIAGEGIGGVINAILQIAEVSGDIYGTNVACPGYC